MDIQYPAKFLPDYKSFLLAVHFLWDILNLGFHVKNQKRGVNQSRPALLY